MALSIYTDAMNRIGIIVNTKRPRSPEILGRIRRWAAGCGMELYAETAEMAGLLGATCVPIEDFGKTVDLVFALGGDGTVLYASRALHGSDVPIMGINLGSLGFLTSVADSELDAALDAVSCNACKVSTRLVAECRIFRGGRQVGGRPALNDVVLGWGASSRIVTLGLCINGNSVGSFMCDGMIVSTPTGSTGHALSAGGPILHPGIGAFGINVICPHTLGTRPLVVPDSHVIGIEVANAAKELILSIDGQDEFTIERGDRIEVVKSPHAARFLQLQGHDYFSVLSKKLHWRGSSL